MVGLNQTPGGFFVNFYLNRPDPFFGDYDPPHISRHRGLIAARYTARSDFFSASQGVVHIDDRKMPEELPWCSVTRDLYLPPVGKSTLKSRVDRPLIVPIEDVPDGVLVRVKIWPRHLEPTDEDMKKAINVPPNYEPLVATFVPRGFTNPVVVGAFRVDRLMRDAPFFIDEPLKSSSKGPTYGPQITLHGPRAGRR